MGILLEHDITRAHVHGLIQDRMNELDHCLFVLVAPAAWLLKLIGLYNLEIFWTPSGAFDRKHGLDDSTRIDRSAFGCCNEAFKRAFICQDLLDGVAVPQRSFDFSLQSGI